MGAKGYRLTYMVATGYPVSPRTWKAASSNVGFLGKSVYNSAGGTFEGKNRAM